MEKRGVVSEATTLPTSVEMQQKLVAIPLMETAKREETLDGDTVKRLATAARQTRQA